MYYNIYIKVIVIANHNCNHINNKKKKIIINKYLNQLQNSQSISHAYVISLKLRKCMYHLRGVGGENGGNCKSKYICTNIINRMIVIIVLKEW